VPLPQPERLVEQRIAVRARNRGALAGERQGDLFATRGRVQANSEGMTEPLAEPPLLSVLGSPLDVERELVAVDGSDRRAREWRPIPRRCCCARCAASDRRHQAGSPSLNGSAAFLALESDIVPPDRTLLTCGPRCSHSQGKRARLAPQAPEQLARARRRRRAHLRERSLAGVVRANDAVVVAEDVRDAHRQAPRRLAKRFDA
jgi:hypothetical protein